MRVDGAPCTDPDHRVDPARAKISVRGETLSKQGHVYIILNKPRGLVTTSADEKHRETVFSCFAGADLSHISPVGRLDKASEGLLLFTNDTQWANAMTSPTSHLDKLYHVQINAIADDSLLDRLRAGLAAEGGDKLAIKQVNVLRQGIRNCWLEIALDEGKNRQIRRLLDAVGIEVLRLVRIAIGPLRLGELSKGQWRYLSVEEVAHARASESPTGLPLADLANIPKQKRSRRLRRRRDQGRARGYG